MPKHEEKKYSSLFVKGHYSYKYQLKMTTLELDLASIQQNLLQILAQYVKACRRKVWKTMYKIFLKRDLTPA